jgi:prepilin-type processing-associated H-X9-DG protein
MWTGQTNGELVHGGLFNFNFLDGHAKMVQMHVGFARSRPFGPAVPYLFPKNSNDDAKWCANVQEEVSVPSGLRAMTMPCGQVVDYFRQQVTTWAPD